MGYKFDPKTKQMVKPEPHGRAYPQVTNTQFIEGWAAATTSANSELRGGLRRLVNLSRDLGRSNPYIRNFLDLWSAYMFGQTGFTLQSCALNAAGREDTDARNRIEDAWLEWKDAENCTVTGDMPWGEFKSTSERAAANDGNVVIVMHPGWKENKYRFAVQLLEFDRIDTDYDATRLRNGNRIVMGKEIDRYGRCVAFHLRGDHPGETYHLDGRQRTRIEGENIIHRFYRSRPEAVFGEPLVVGAITALRHLEKYEEAEQIASRIAACASVAIERDDTAEWDGNNYADDRELTPAGFLDLGAGESAKLLNPTHPNANYENFRKGILMGAASALPAMGYPVLGSDLSQVNFSSLREDGIVRRMVIKPYREMNIAREERPIFKAFMKSAILARQFRGFEMSNFDNLTRSKFYGSGFEMVDPWKVGKGLELMLQLNMADPYELAIEHTGKPLPELLENVEKARELFKQHGQVPAWLGESQLSTPDEEATLGQDE